MKRSVHIVSIAARTPVGLTAEAAAAAVRAGIGRVREHPILRDARGAPLLCASDQRLSPVVFGVPRLEQLALHVLRRILAVLDGNRFRGMQLPVQLALPDSRPGFGVREASELRQMLEARIGEEHLPLSLECSQSGHAGALQALERACELVESSTQEVCLVGGVDSYLRHETLDWLDCNRQLMRTGCRAGFHPGEGAAMLALVSEDVCRRLQLRSLARVAATACGREARDAAAGPGLLGETLSALLRQLRNDVPEPIDDIYCDINGERTRSTEWGFALLREGSWFREGTRYTSGVESWGDQGAASGALSIILAIRAWNRKYAHGHRALIWGGSWEGLRGAVILEHGDP